MSKVYETLKEAQARQGSQGDIKKPDVNIESKSYNTVSVPSKSADTGRAVERVVLGVAFFMMIVLVVSVVVLSNSVSSMKKSIEKVGASIDSLALKADDMGISLKNTGADLVVLKDESTRTQEAIRDLDDRFGSYDMLQNKLAGRVDKLESSLQAVDGRLVRMEEKASVPASPEKPQPPPSQGKEAE